MSDSRRRLLTASALLVLAAVLGACGNAPTASPTASDAASSIDGYLFFSGTAPTERSSDGTRHAGVALGRDTTAPAGYAALGGAAVDLFAAPAGGPVATTATASTKTAADGLAKLDKVPAGLYRMRIATPSGTVAEFPLTLVGGASLRWGAYPVTRDRAFEIAKRGVASALRPEMTLILAPQTPLPAGASVADALADEDAPATVTKLTRSHWFFYVDPFAHTKFAHPTKYVFVDAESGAASVRDARSWPAINGLSYYFDPETVALSPDQLESPPRRAARAEADAASANADALVRGGLHGLLRPLADHVPNCPAPKTYALLIQGSDEGPSDEDIGRIKAILGRGGIPTPVTSHWKPTGGPSPADEVFALWMKIKQQATECDQIFVYVTAHGIDSGRMLLDTTALNKDGTPKKYSVFHLKQLDWKNCRACHITIVLDFCYAGKMLQELIPVFTPLTGRKVVMMSSTDATHQATAFQGWTVRGAKGSAFTSAFTQSFDTQAASGSASLGRAFDDASTDLAGTMLTPSVREQNPQFWERKLLPGETCALQSSPTPPPTTPPPPPPTTPPPSITPARQTTGPAAAPTTTSRPSEPAPATPAPATAAPATAAPPIPAPATPAPATPAPATPAPATPQPTTPAPAPALSAMYKTYNTSQSFTRDDCGYSPASVSVTVSGNPDGSSVTITVNNNRPPDANPRVYTGSLKADGTFTGTGSGAYQKDFASNWTGSISGKIANGTLTATEDITLAANSWCTTGQRKMVIQQTPR